MTGYFKIENAGEIEVEAFRLIGASTKRDDNTKIGFFGSGLKYAIAVLLREGIPFTVYSGGREVKITTRKTTMRGKDFEVIHIDGKATSLTTEMGPTWLPWFAVREIFCNAIDEGGHAIGIAPMPSEIKGKTVFYIGIDDKLKAVLEKWNDYFSEKREDVVSTGRGVKFFYGGNNTIIYRKGVQVFTSNTPSLYHYDGFELEINESRVLSGDWEVKHNIAQYFVKNATVEMARNFFLNYKGKLEESFYWHYMHHSFNENWLKALDERWLVPEEYAGNFLEEMEGKSCLILPKVIIDALVATFGSKLNVIGIVTDDGEVIKKPTEKQQAYIDEALTFLKTAGFEVNHEIVIVDFKNIRVLGRARDSTIQLAGRVFDMGKKIIVATILEEESHLVTGAADKTREFQDYLFMKIVTLMEEKTNITL